MKTATGFCNTKRRHADETGRAAQGRSGREYRREDSMKKLEIIVRHSRFNAVKDALVALGIHGMSVRDVKGFGRQNGHKETYRGAELTVEFVPKVKMEVVVESGLVDPAIEAVKAAACTGGVGDGKIFVLPVENAIRIRTGETGDEAL